MKSTSENIALINAFSGKRILVIGDLLMHIYLKGVSTRLCSEAPAPIVDICERTVLPGGAANIVCNLNALGASVAFCTVIGADHSGEEVIALLEAQGLDHRHIIRDPKRSTSTKSRVVAGSRVITRLDQGSENPVREAIGKRLVHKVENLYYDCDAIILSDYDKGVITTPLIDALQYLNHQHPKFIAIDSKRPAFFSRLHPSHCKPNYEDVTKLLSIPYQPSERVGQIVQYAEALYKKVNASVITVTLDRDGSLVIENGKPVDKIQAPSVTHPHVAGAGDSYLSAFVLSYLESNDASLSARIATAAADIAIRKERAASCSQTELKSYFNIHSKFIADLHELKAICEEHHTAGKRIVFTSGCFDILHSGHVSYLLEAKALGDILIVGLNTDESITRIKGENRPVNALTDRIHVLAGLSSVNHVIPFGSEEDDTSVPLIEIVRPHIFVKGCDYTKETLPEVDAVESCGGEIVLLDRVPDHSTTPIIHRVFQEKQKF